MIADKEKVVQKERSAIKKVKNRQVASMLAGLKGRQKKISSKYFYDSRGSALFEEITALPEYYPYRTEKEIIPKVAKGLDFSGPETDLIELGSGDCSKISLFLNSLSDRDRAGLRYVPVDICKSAIEQSTRRLRQLYPGLTIHGVTGDFTRQLDRLRGGRKKVICFFGSTFGNLSDDEQLDFLNQIRKNMQHGDRFLMGVDMVKDQGLIERAYNDSSQVTAAFNKNILLAFNNRAQTDFDPANFDHLAFYNRQSDRIEMHLKANTGHYIDSPWLDHPIKISKDETIHTENSHKFTDERIQLLAKESGLITDAVYADSQKWFSIYQLKNKADAGGRGESEPI